MIDHAKALEYAQYITDKQPMSMEIPAVIGLCQAYLDLHQRMQWRPINTAPRDGILVLLSFPHSDIYGPWVGIGRWDVLDEPIMWKDAQGNMPLHQPTAWQHLPLPPSQEKAG